MKKIIDVREKETDLNELITEDFDDKRIQSFFVSDEVKNDFKIGDVIDGIETREF